MARNPRGKSTDISMEFLRYFSDYLNNFWDLPGDECDIKAYGTYSSPTQMADSNIFVSGYFFEFLEKLRGIVEAFRGYC